MLQVGVQSIIKINGIEVARAHNTILNAGFNVIGRRIFDTDANYSTQIKWIRYTFSDLSPLTFATAYTETSNTVHKIAYTWVSDQTPCNLTSIHAMFANSTSDSYIAASYTFASLPVNSSDTVIAEFIFTLSGNSWQNAGFQIIGHRCFDQANSYTAPLNYYSFDGGTTRIAVGAAPLTNYANISNTVHDLNTTIATTETSNSTRLYNAATSGTLGFSQSVTRNLVAGQPFKFRLTVGQ